MIDGIDISTISLNDLRSNINIIPQSPVLFSNTLRYNLDPFKHYTDEQLWDALESVQLKTKISKLKDQLNIQIAEYGSNFSVGECQLICVARAILKRSKILLVDEATAHVDTKTDELIQQVLREKFVNQTILTIAHRLHTIMDSDKIVVMNAGIIASYGMPKEVLPKENEILTEMKNDNELLTETKDDHELSTVFNIECTLLLLLLLGNADSYRGNKHVEFSTFSAAFLLFYYSGHHQHI